jgi:hypothetical protein
MHSNPPQPTKIEIATESSCAENYTALREDFMRELLRQAHLSYNLALVITTGSALITLAGVGLLYLEKITAASVTTAGGAIASISCIQLAKESKEELHQVIERLRK